MAAQLSDALSTFHSEPSVNQRFAAAGIETAVMPAAEFATYITAELTKWRDVVMIECGADVIFSFLFFLEDGVHRLNRFALTLHNTMTLSP